MQILWVLNRMELGGIEIYTTDVLPLLQKHFSVALFLTHGEGRLVEKVKRSGIPVYFAKIKGTLNRKRIKEATKIIKGLSPQIVHTHNFRSHFSIRIASILAGVRGIIPHYHSMPGERFTPKTLEWEKKLFSCSDKILFVSHPAQMQYQKLLNIAPQSKAAKKLVTISNAFQLDSFYKANLDAVEKLRISYKLKKEQPVIGLVARIAPVKCIETLIDTVDILRHKIHNLKCMIIGEGEENYVNSLKNLVAEKKLTDHFIFTGYRQDVADHIRLFTCGVLCSSHEGLPHFLIEAFASGVPVVGSDIEGIRQVMTEGQEGLYAKVNDPYSLAEAIERIISNPELRKQMSKNAVRKSQEFNINEHINKLCTIYDSLLSAPDRETEKARSWFRLKYRLKL